MGKSLDELTSYFRPLAEELISQCTAAGIPTTICDTGRTPEEQQIKIAQHVSWTQHSKHLPQPPEMLSEAIDLAVTEYLTEKGWNPGGPLWEQIGVIGEGLGLLWGGRWTHINNGNGDKSHFQYIHPPADLSLQGDV